MSNNIGPSDTAFDGLKAFFREENVASKHSRIKKQLLDHTTDLGTVWRAFQGTKMVRPGSQERRVGEACEIGKDRTFWAIRGRDIGKPQKLLETFDKEPLPSGPRNQKRLENFDSVYRHCKDFWDEVRSQEASALKATGCTKADVEPLISWISYDEELDHLSDLEKE